LCLESQVDKELLFAFGLLQFAYELAQHQIDRFELGQEIIYFSLISGPIWVISYTKFIIYKGASNGAKIVAWYHVLANPVSRSSLLARNFLRQK
jgi:hypothetical protein